MNISRRQALKWLAPLPWSLSSYADTQKSNEPPNTPKPGEWQTRTVTAYCPCVKCCGKSDGITASGKKAVEGLTVAANWLPLGTIVEIENVGTRKVMDRMSKKYPDRLDVFFNSHEQAKKFGIKQLKVRVVSYPQTKKITQPQSPLKNKNVQEMLQSRPLVISLIQS